MGTIRRKKQSRKVTKNGSLQNHLVKYDICATNHRLTEKIRLERFFFGFHLDQPPAQMRASFNITSGCLLKQLKKDRAPCS